jgi:hypothetical protein
MLLMVALTNVNGGFIDFVLLSFLHEKRIVTANKKTHIFFMITNLISQFNSIGAKIKKAAVKNQAAFMKKTKDFLFVVFTKKIRYKRI